MQPEIPQGYPPQPMYSEEQVPVSPDEIYAGQMQEERVKNVLSQISPENQLEEVEMRIRGYKRNIHSGEWEKINPDAPEISQLLVQRYISYLSSILNQNTTMGNLSSIQIAKMMKLIIEWLVDDLEANAETYGIGHNYSERTRIGHIMLNLTFTVLNRSINGTESRRIWGSLNLSESSNPFQQNNQSKDWWKVWKK